MNYQLDAILNIALIVFIMLALVVTSTIILKNLTDNIVIPIEDLLKKIKRLSQNPLEAVCMDEEEALAKNQLLKHRSYVVNKTHPEIRMLETSINKISALLALGFGEAGSAIIQKNLNSDGELDPLLPGKKVVAIFGFCDIRNFTNVTEVLQDRVILFVNEIAEIVHSTCDANHGFANKNIGDAFLIVWKFPEDVVAIKDNDEIIIKNAEAATGIADLSFISFLKIMAELKKSPQIQMYNELLNREEGLEGYIVRMGYALHVGWAIEGPIGSEYKIDVS